MTKGKIRKLTEKECWRLMGFDDKDFDAAKQALIKNIYNGKDRTSTQLYKQAGNSIVVDVLYHIMENLYEAMPYLFEDMKVASFFSGIGAFEKAFDKVGERHGEDVADSENDDLKQIGYINSYNDDANRVYDNKIARTLKSEAGGGGAKTGWYTMEE